MSIAHNILQLNCLCEKISGHPAKTLYECTRTGSFFASLVYGPVNQVEFCIALLSYEWLREKRLEYPEKCVIMSREPRNFSRFMTCESKKALTESFFVRSAVQRDMGCCEHIPHG